MDIVFYIIRMDNYICRVIIGKWIYIFNKNFFIGKVL